jgi:beta-lactamase class D
MKRPLPRLASNPLNLPLLHLPHVPPNQHQPWLAKVQQNQCVVLASRVAKMTRRKMEKCMFKLLPADFFLVPERLLTEHA